MRENIKKDRTMIKYFQNLIIAYNKKLDTMERNQTRTVHLAESIKESAYSATSDDDNREFRKTKLRELVDFASKAWNGYTQPTIRHSLIITNFINAYNRFIISDIRMLPNNRKKFKSEIYKLKTAVNDELSKIKD